MLSKQLRKEVRTKTNLRNLTGYKTIAWTQPTTINCSEQLFLENASQFAASDDKMIETFRQNLCYYLPDAFILGHKENKVSTLWAFSLQTPIYFIDLREKLNQIWAFTKPINLTNIIGEHNLIEMPTPQLWRLQWNAEWKIRKWRAVISLTKSEEN